MNSATNKIKEDQTNANVKYIRDQQPQQQSLSKYVPDLTPPVQKEYQHRALKQHNWATYNLSQEEEFPLFLDLLSNTLEQLQTHPSGTRGRPRYSLYTILLCSAVTIYYTFSTRRSPSLLRDLQKQGIIRAIPDFSTIRRYLRKPAVTDTLIHLIEQTATLLIPYETTFAVDSSGFSSFKFHRWVHARLDKRERIRDFKKAHICIGVKSGIITAIAITDSNHADIKCLPTLLNTTKNNGFTILEVVADKAYNSREQYNFIHNLGAVPFIPFKKGSTGRSAGSFIWKRTFQIEKENPDYFYNHYHQRSTVESSFSSVKRKFLDFTRAKTDNGQINEILLKYLCQNLCILARVIHFQKPLQPPNNTTESH